MEPLVQPVSFEALARDLSPSLRRYLQRYAGDASIADEMSTCVRQVIDSLPDDYRAALVLHDLGGESAEQTAEICGCSLATAKIRIHRARQRLRKALQQQCEFYRDADDVLRCDRKSCD